MDLTFENLEFDNTAFPSHLTIMNCSIRQEKLWFKYGSSTKQHRIMKHLDWNGPLDVPDLTLSRVMSRQVLSISKAGGYRVPLGSLLQHLTTLGVNLSFLYPIVSSWEYWFSYSCFLQDELISSLLLIAIKQYQMCLWFILVYESTKSGI